MAQFAPVAPIQILEAMKKDSPQTLGTYHLLLAHHVLEYPDRFKALFADLSGCTIIMDNSIVELGDSQNEDKVLEACTHIDPTGNSLNWVIPVLTDVMGDGAATREAASKSYDFWKGKGYPLMVVAQGGNGDKTMNPKDVWTDFCQTVDHFLLSGNYPVIEYVGIPRKLVESLGTRQLAIQYVEAVRPDINIHLLGFSDDVTDDVISANHPGVEGIDSAVPLRYSYSVPDGLYTPTATIPARPKDWFENGEFDKVVAKNLYNMRRWVA